MNNILQEEFYSIIFRNKKGDNALSIRTKPTERIVLNGYVINVEKFLEILQRIPEEWLK